jgi:IS30 family transposase
LRDAIQKPLLEQWSSRQVSHQKRLDYPGQPEIHLVPESIYQAVHSPQINVLSRKMSGHLHTGQRGCLSHRRTTTRRSRFSGPLWSERPPGVDSRLVPGHRQGDLVCDTFNRLAMGTLVERTNGTLFGVLALFSVGFNMNNRATPTFSRPSWRRHPEAHRGLRWHPLQAKRW